MRNLHVLAMVALFVGGGRAFADETAWQAKRLWVVGSDDQTWIVGASNPKDEKLPEVRMWWSRADHVDGVPSASSPFLPPIDGDPARVGSNADGLWVLFSNGATWHYFGKRQASAGANWNERCRELPVAWAGDASKPVFWALAETAKLVDDKSSASQPTSAAAEEESDEKPDQSRLTLLRIRQGSWDRLSVPERAESGKAFWLAGRDENAWLFWQDPSNKITCCFFDDGNWKSPETVVPESDLVRGWAGAGSEGPVFAAGRGQADRIQLHIYLRGSDGWSHLGAAREGSDYLTLDSDTCGVGVGQGRLGVARLDARGRVEFGRADLNGSPLLRFAALPERTEVSPGDMKWRDLIGVVASLGILTLALYHRREQVNQPAAVPKGFVIASPWRRILAASIDLAPAIIVISLCVDVGVINEALGLSNDPVALKEPLSEPDFKQTVMWNLLLASVYGLWCLIWELASGTTLGKRIFDCRVLSSDGFAPTARQIIVRNVVRIVTLSLSVPGLMMTLMLMLMFTRNRQRLGDLLANTIVVQPDAASAVPQARQHDGDDSSDDGG